MYILFVNNYFAYILIMNNIFIIKQEKNVTLLEDI